MPFLRSITFDYNSTLTYISSRGKVSISTNIFTSTNRDRMTPGRRQDKFWPHLAKLKYLHTIRVKGMPESVWTGKSNALLDLVMDTWVTPGLETLRSIRGGKGNQKQEKKVVLRWEHKIRSFSA